MKTVEDVKQAMERGELCAFYQPQYDALSGKLASAEALVRWILGCVSLRIPKGV